MNVLRILILLPSLLILSVIAAENNSFILEDCSQPEDSWFQEKDEHHSLDVPYHVTPYHLPYQPVSSIKIYSGECERDSSLMEPNFTTEIDLDEARPD